MTVGHVMSDPRTTQIEYMVYMSINMLMQVNVEAPSEHVYSNNSI